MYHDVDGDAEAEALILCCPLTVRRLRKKLSAPFKLYFTSPSNTHCDRKYLRGNSAALRRIMVAGFDVELQAFFLSDGKAKASVYASRTYPCACESDRSALTGITPPAPGRDTWSARWHRKVFQLGTPVVPPPTPNDVVSEAFSFSAVHIVCRQRIDIVGRVDGSHRTRETWVRRGIQQTECIQDW